MHSIVEYGKRPKKEWIQAWFFIKECNLI
jgi:hypothetical protein